MKYLKICIKKTNIKYDKKNSIGQKEFNLISLSHRITHFTDALLNFLEDFRVKARCIVQNSWRIAWTHFGGERKRKEGEKERKSVLLSSPTPAVLDLNTGLILRTKRHMRKRKMGVTQMKELAGWRMKKGKNRGTSTHEDSGIQASLWKRGKWG